MPPGDRVASHVLPEGRGPSVTFAVVGDEAATDQVNDGGLLGLEMGAVVILRGISAADGAEGVPRVPSAKTGVAVTWY